MHLRTSYINLTKIRSLRPSSLLCLYNTFQNSFNFLSAHRCPRSYTELTKVKLSLELGQIGRYNKILFGIDNLQLLQYLAYRHSIYQHNSSPYFSFLETSTLLEYSSYQDPLTAWAYNLASVYNQNPVIITEVFQCFFHSISNEKPLLNILINRREKVWVAF